MSLKAQLPSHQAYSRRNRVGLTSKERSFQLLVGDIVRHFIADRKKFLRSDRLRDFRKNVECLLLDLLSASETSDDLWIGYSRGKSNFTKGGSYWNETTGQPDLSPSFYLASIDLLERHGFIENVVADAGHMTFSSRMRPTEKLRQEFKARGLNWTHIYTVETAPCIVVKDENKKVCPWPPAEDFPLIEAIARLKRINDNFRSTYLNLNVSDEELSSINEHLLANHEGIEDQEYEPDPIDFSNRSLRRIFAMRSFSCGGRFYGGWWQSVPSKYRKHIEINGAITVELDYSTIQPRMLYAMKSLEPPEDSYIIPGWDPELRKVTKKVFSQLLNSDKSSRHPNQWHRFAPAMIPDPLPVNWSSKGRFERYKVRREAFSERTGRDYSELIQDVLDYHEPIQDFFFTGIWTKTQHLDSQIVEKVLTKMLDRDVPETVLPIHDSFIIRRGGEEILRYFMIEAFNEVIPSNVKIDRDETVFDLPEGYVPGGPIVASPERHESVKEWLQTHRGYHTRQHQMESTWGPL